MIAIALVLLLSFAASFVLTPLIRNVARGRGWVDQPDGVRKLHEVPVPRLGGIAVYLSFALSFGMLLLLDPPHDGHGMSAPQAYGHLLLSGAAILLVGLVDDLRGVRPAAKIAVQAAAGAYLYFVGFRIENLTNPFGSHVLHLDLLSLPITLLWFVGMSNAFNLIDGLDGLAAGVGFFSTTTLFIAALVNERWEVVILATALGGALLGFLRYNFNPATIFLGDSGSLFIGFALAAFAVRGSMKSSAAIAVAAPLMALALPILDATVAVLRRFIVGGRIFEGDGDHIHHRILRRGLPPRRAVIVLYGFAALFGALSLLSLTEKSQVVGMVVIAFSLVCWIGVQQLGYSEFGEVRRVLTQGFGYERQVIANNVYLAALPARFREAEGSERLMAVLSECVARLEFDGYHVQVGESSDGLRGAPRSAAVSIWNIPLSVNDQPVATLTLSRPLGKNPPFEIAHLLGALSIGFAPRLEELLREESPGSIAPDTRSAAFARARGA